MHTPSHFLSMQIAIATGCVSQLSAERRIHCTSLSMNGTTSGGEKPWFSGLNGKNTRISVPINLFNVSPSSSSSWSWWFMRTLWIFWIHVATTTGPFICIFSSSQLGGSWCSACRGAISPINPLSPSLSVSVIIILGGNPQFFMVKGGGSLVKAWPLVDGRKMGRPH